MKRCKVPLNVRRMANAAGISIRQLHDNKVVLTKTSDGSTIAGPFRTADEARAGITKLMNTNVPDLDGGTVIPFRGQAMIGSPTRIGDQPKTLVRKIDEGTRVGIAGLSAGLGRFVTPFKQVAQHVEGLGGGAMFTKVYETTQKAANTVHRLLAFESREELKALVKGKMTARTYQKSLQDLERSIAKAGLNAEQKEWLVLASEAMTKGELEAAGMLLPKGFDDAHRNVSGFFQQLGLAEDIPRLFRTNAVIDDFIANRARTINENIPRMRREINEGVLPEEMGLTLDRISGLVGDEDSILAVMEKMNIPGNEAAGMVILRMIMGAKISEPALLRLVDGFLVEPIQYSIPAIFRHAIAPELKAGFKNGEEQFMRENGFTPQMMGFVVERNRIIDTAFGNFREGKINRIAMLNAQLPAIRQFIDVGIWPTIQRGADSAGVINEYTRVIADAFPGATELLGRRVLSGHINPYELHPVISANKHIRNLLMKEHMDPVIEATRPYIKNITTIDPSLTKPISEYINEMQGIPNEAFAGITRVIQKTFSYVGLTADDQLAERFVATLMRISSQAALPLRPALVLRNYVSQTLFVGSFIGPEAWHHGMKVALGRGKGEYKFASMREAIGKAINDGVIDANVLPIHSHAETSMFDVSRYKNVPLAKLQALTDQMFDAGFSLYRSGDDFGRTVAYFAGQFRVNKHLGDFIGKKISLETFKERAKVKIFHETIEAQFDQLIAEGLYDNAAKLIGKQLADKTHFLYGNANHPVGWGGPVGRLFGQFGTFPTQYIQAVMEGVTRGTLKDRAEFVATHSAFNMGIVAVGAEVFDADLTSWSMFGGLNYSGGPYTDVAINFAMMWNGNDAEKGLARRNLAFMLPTLENPRSILIPGSYAVSDWVRATQEDDFGRAFLRFTGVRPSERTDPENFLQDALGWMRDR